MKRLNMIAILFALLLSGSTLAWSQDVPNKTARPILVVGDSLSAEYGLRRGAGWVALLAARLQAEKLPYSVINASISGETTAGGRSRIDDLLKQHKPAWVLIELGGNDALRGLDLAGTESNLRTMTQAARRAKARVLLIGMMVPPNYGKTYTRQFSGLFEQLARSEQSALVPFLLDGIADRLEMFQSDRIHPNEAAQERLFQNVWTVLQPLLKADRIK
jgi:acyl-CoA thioesterase I